MSAVALLLTGCGAAESSPNVAIGLAAAPPLGTALTISLANDTIAIEGEDGVVYERLSLSDGQDVLNVLTQYLGSSPTATPIPGVPDISYDWGGLCLTLTSDTYATVTFSTASVGSFQLRGPDGIAVGAASSDVHGAVDSPDADRDGYPDSLRVDLHEVPGTIARGSQPTTGSRFVELVLERSAITEITAPANDFLAD